MCKCYGRSDVLNSSEVYSCDLREIIKICPNPNNPNKASFYWFSKVNDGMIAYIIHINVKLKCPMQILLESTLVT